ncbi:MAG: hypothetical protein JWM46_631 [Candidatus Kaiserbacteria bacterium]|nr:hypothetical protein [Candidatus Kaiserbacteria bacterium]
MSEKTLILIAGGEQDKIVSSLGLTQRLIGGTMFIGPYSGKELPPIEQKLRDAAAKDVLGLTAYFIPARVVNYSGTAIADEKSMF